MSPRQGGGVTTMASPAPDTSKPSTDRMRFASASGTSTPHSPAIRECRSPIWRRHFGASPATTSSLASPPQISCTSRVATSAPQNGEVWSRPRSNR